MSFKAAIAVLVAFTGTLSTHSAFAEETGGDWVGITETSDFAWHAKKSSGYVATFSGVKNSSYAYVYQIEDKHKKTYKYGKIFVKLDACRKGYGYVYYNDLQGTYTGKEAFVRYGGTVVDHLGSLSCNTWDSDTKGATSEPPGNLWEVAATAAASGNHFSLKNGTARKRNHNGKPAMAALYGYKDVKANTTTYSEYVMTVSDCKQGYGTIYEMNFDGEVVKKNDVVLSGDSVIAAVASNLCGKA